MKATSTPPRFAWPWWLFFGYLAGLALTAGGYYGWLVWVRNLHEVVPGRVFRSAQVDLPLLRHALERHGIRTVISLRGGNPGLPWYDQEVQSTHRLNLSQHDIHLSAYRLPPATELRRLVEVLDHCDYPILIHCQHGADRTGLISALILLLYTDESLDEAERQFGLAFARVSLGQTANLDRFCQLYREWLSARSLHHSPTLFRHWLEHAYCPDGLHADLEWLDTSSPVPVGRPFAVRVRATNSSDKTWPFRTGETAGYHALYYLVDARGRLVESARAGLFHADVAPGESVELTIPLPALPKPGRYHLLVDLNDGRRGMLFQFGSKPLICELQAVESPRSRARQDAANIAQRGR